MKKHVFGFALFSFIVASFALVYTFFYAPSIPPKDSVKPPISQAPAPVEKPYTCQYKRNTVSHEILSSQFLVEKNEIVSKIRIALDRGASLPEKVYVSTNFSSVGNIGKDGFGDFEVLENPFSEGREKIVTVVSKVKEGESVVKNENLYVTTTVTDYDASASYKKANDITQAKAVLFVFGESSYIKPGKPIVRERAATQ